MKPAALGARQCREILLLLAVAISVFGGGPDTAVETTSAAVRSQSAVQGGPTVRAEGIVAAHARLPLVENRERGRNAENADVYVTLTNTADRADQLESVVSPDAQSAIWVTAKHRHSQEEINNLAQQCGSDPRLVAAGLAALADSGDVHLPAHAIVDLAPGVGRLELVHPLRPLRVGGFITIELWFYRGAHLRLRVPVTHG